VIGREQGRMRERWREINMKTVTERQQNRDGQLEREKKRGDREGERNRKRK